VDLAKRIEAGPRITCLRPTCEVQKYGREPISLHTPLGEDGDGKFGDLVEDSEAIQPGEERLNMLAPISGSHHPAEASRRCSDAAMSAERTTPSRAAGVGQSIQSGPLEARRMARSACLHHEGLVIEPRVILNRRAVA
jgi:Sigma-70 region 3